MEQNIIEIVSAIIVILIAILLNTKAVKNFWAEHINGVVDANDHCFDCDKSSCIGCPTWNPLLNLVSSAYVVVKRNGKVLATCTLTFKEDFVITQHPSNNPIVDFVGKYKTEVLTWSVTNENNLDKEVSFS